ncbi:dimethylarginine dimethylaminohydrolase family protein [Euzebya tangerina]|uniref:dimethylarginine dimethylaminohydrolase family protein n=1 Tax=Euzebya tangerina TaxID=591198 RepID=UPI000E310D84|nr:arginine deiminase-related protein [Euzebya tangerina]
MSDLTWGQRYAMCAPTFFDVVYSINPWMGGTVDPDVAMTQWETLAAAIRMAGGEVDVVQPMADLPDMVFVANAGVVSGPAFIPGAMRYPERAPETAAFVQWAGAVGFTVERLPEGAVLEGTGDAMPLGDVVVSGYGARTNRAAHAALTRLTDVEVVPVRLQDPRWYHVDLTLCPLDSRRAMVYPEAYDRAGAAAVIAHIAEPLVLTEAEAATFAANSIVVGRTVIMPACPPRVGRLLEAWGFDVVVVDVGEFQKAGGAVRCLTLPLDTSIGRDRVAQMEVA